MHYSRSVFYVHLSYCSGASAVPRHSSTCGTTPGEAHTARRAVSTGARLEDANTNLKFEFGNAFSPFNMIILEHRYLLMLVLLPVLLRAVLPPVRREQRAIKIPWFERIKSFAGREKALSASSVGSSWLTTAALFLIWSLVVIAMTRPQWLENPIVNTLPTRDILLLIDLSGSMETEDFKDSAGKTVNRLDAVKEVVDEFLEKREGDRVGLIVFGNAAFVQVPFTSDLQACRDLLRECEVRMAGPKTALGDAIGLGITLFERSEVKERLIIALTDGNDTGSKVEPSVAAKIAADNDVVIHLVGVGDPQAAGEEKLDEQTLKGVASAAGGQYFHAADRERLKEIYAEIDRISSHEIKTESYRPRQELFHYPLAAAFVLSLVMAVTKVYGLRSQSVIQTEGGSR